jgi:hypothetical protein
MLTKLRIIVLLLTIAAGAFAAEQVPLPEDFPLAGAEGTFHKQGDGRFFFVFDADHGKEPIILKAGTKIEFLKCSATEMLVADVNDRADARYRLWGKLTQYKKENYIYAIYLLALGEERIVEDIPQAEPEPEDKKTDAPADEFAIPTEVIQKLKQKRIVRVRQIEKALELKTDFILADRTGLLQRQGKKISFELDGVGRNIENIKFKLLPCQALERAEATSDTDLERYHFKAAGIVTQYKGENYLLLQRASKVYSHGNFGI